MKLKTNINTVFHHIMYIAHNRIASSMTMTIPEMEPDTRLTVARSSQRQSLCSFTVHDDDHY